ncbi:ribonuclease III [Chloroflexota bacterium]
MADLVALQQIIGVSFDDQSFLEQALVHSSFINENAGFAPVSNERMEFLGDAVLGLVIAEKIYRDSPHLNEGEMTKLRAALVCQDTLSRVAGDFSLGDYLSLGKGEEMGGGRLKPTNMARALEAVIAAVFLDQGLDTARSFILRLFDAELHRIVIQKAERADYKSQLQELIQARKQLVPTYRLVEAAGPDHAKEFTAEVRAGDAVLGRGTGKSKRMAETEAARLALDRLSKDFD